MLEWGGRLRDAAESLRGRERESLCVCLCVHDAGRERVSVCVGWGEMQGESVCRGGAAGRVCVCVCVCVCTTPCRLSVLVSIACQTCSCLQLQKSQTPESLPILFPPADSLHHCYSHRPPCRSSRWTPCFAGSLEALCTPAVVESSMLPST